MSICRLSQQTDHPLAPFDHPWRHSGGIELSRFFDADSAHVIEQFGTKGATDRGKIDKADPN